VLGREGLMGATMGRTGLVQAAYKHIELWQRDYYNIGIEKDYA